MWLLLLSALVGCVGSSDKGPGDAEDSDGDGYAAADDCDDGDAAVHPGAVEVCDPADVDEDCSGAADDADPDAQGLVTAYQDADGDGYGYPAVQQSVCDVLAGWTTDATDCDDGNPAISPGATEVCDAADVDEDCSGAADDADPGVDPSTRVTVWADLDGDGYGDAGDAASVCDPAAGTVDNAEDCDDADLAVSPDGVETCDGVDDDCDGVVDPDDAIDAATWYADADGDGYGDLTRDFGACAAPDGYVADATDCDDTRADVSPAGTETCDGVDDDCDGTVDPATAADASAWYADHDGDGDGAGAATLSCTALAGRVTNVDDCDDADAAVSPGATEVCDALDTDEDCSGLADDFDTGVDASTRTATCADADGDGYGDPSSVTHLCDPPSSRVTDATDCDDADAAAHPGASEVCDAASTDEDCDGLADDADPSVDTSGYTSVWTDADGDGYGDDATETHACHPGAGQAAVAGDCDDTTAAISPAGTEACDAADADEDCDGLADDADTGATGGTSWYMDADGDGYGDGSAVTRCDATSGYAAVDGDCDDTDSAANPGAHEVCADGVDQDCDGATACVDAASVAGRTFSGDATGDYAGYYVAYAGDVDGDGTGDMLVDAPYNAARGTHAGASYLVSGVDTGDVYLPNATAVIEGAAAYYDGGYGIAGLGDLDGDGYDDFATAATEAAYGSGHGGVLLWYGPVSGSFTTSDADVSIANAMSYAGIGERLVNAGDTDGDGRDDLLACFATDAANPGAVVLLDDLDGSVTSTSGAAATFSYTWTTYTPYMGGAAAGGDFDGDGLSDLAMNAFQVSSRTDYGRVMLYQSPVTGANTQSTADTLLYGDGNYDGMGDSIAFGDLDGDGYQDLVVGAPYYASGAVEGRVYLVAGGSFPASTSVGLAAYATIDGDRTWQDIGIRAATGDVDGDGQADLALTQHFYSQLGVIRGPIPASMGFADADILVQGTYGTLYGTGLTWIPDLDGDGGDELLVGAAAEASNGAAFLYYASNW